MSKKISGKQAMILFTAAILLGFLMIQPFNFICRFTGRCQPLIFSYYLPTIAGKEYFELFFDAKNKSKEVKFETNDGESVITLTGNNISVIYVAKNISNRDIKIRPRPYIFPEEASKYIKFYDCLCFREHRISKGQEIKLVVRLKLDRAIENDPFFKDARAIRVGYQLD